MEPFYPVVQEEYPSNKQSVIINMPQPMEGLHDAGPPPFLTKIYDMVDDQSMDHIVSWSRGGQSFVVWDPHAFSVNLLPRYFKHSNFSSFVRQLNTYGFRKIDPDIWEFANEGFLRGHRDNLKNIKRRKTHSQPISQEATNQPCVEVGKFGMDGEVKHLRRDKQILMMELVRLKQQQQNTRAHLEAMEMRLQGTEKKQQKMMSFLAKAMQNPDFVQKLVRHGKRKDVEECSIMNKKRRMIDHSEGSKVIKDEPEEWEMSELDALALEMQGIGRSKSNQEEVANYDLDDKELDEEFWEELFTEQFGMIENEGL